MLYWRRLTRIIAAMVMLGAGAQALAEDRVLAGAIRWDNWRADSGMCDALDDSALQDRIPYYARRDAMGRLICEGDAPQTVAQDIAYARAAGIDYFIFGYYLETGSWRRDAKAAYALNSAYRAYLALPDRQGVKYALQFNWSFPPADIDEVSDEIVAAARHPDAVRGPTGALPVFMFTPDIERWAKGLGGVDGAAASLADIRRRVREATGAELYVVSMLFGIHKSAPIALDIGFDAISTYANGTGAGGRAVPYGTCAAGARGFWAAGRKLEAGFLPTVTMGWDYRPELRLKKTTVQRDPNPSWCEPAEDAQWSQKIRDAVAEAAANARNERFRSIVFYAWNEFNEGGWISPTKGEGDRRIRVLARALQPK
ncbi:MAG: hypothetical protein NW215_02490 [Hyphomicrobiales bacterium]|nr:hypothetical protein [Hyphomicrobiales bacterium]